MRFTSLLVILLWTLTSAAQQVPSVTVLCTSESERRHCAADTHAGVLLVRSTGPESCLLGRTWGYDADGVWVTEGCGAEFLVAGTGQSSADAKTVDRTASIKGSPEQSGDEGEFSFYSRFGSMMVMTDGETDVQDNGSRLAFEFSTGDDIRFFAKGEWSVNLTGSRTELNPGESTSGGFLTLESTRDEVLGSRLGYVGVDFGEKGTLTLGKQWGVHYDIAGFTDAFNTFGAEASATFNAGTDGGFTGTGRADGALIYRNTVFDIVDIGVQAQFRSLDNDEFLDGYGVSLRVKPFRGLEAGFSYTRAIFDDLFEASLSGLDGDPEYRIAGVKYTSNALTIAAIYSQQRNGDLVRVPIEEDNRLVDVPEVFNADGIEIFTRYQLGSFGLLAGFLNYEPDIQPDNILVDPATLRRYYVAGFDYVPTLRTRLYAEYRFGKGVDPTGVPAEDVFILGAKYEFQADGLFD